MVQKYQSPVRVYKYPFELVMRAYEMRFPTCDMIPIVRETEILEEVVDDVTGIHMIDRRAKLNVDAPYLLKKVIGIDYLLFRQKNTLDRANRTLRIDAWNESFNTRVEIQELCVYSVHPENPDWTCFEQSADLDIKSFFGFEGTAEKLAIKEYSASIGKSKDIMEHYINVLSDQGVTKVDIWQAPTDASNDESEDRENVEDNSPQPKDRSTNLEENKDGKHKKESISGKSSSGSSSGTQNEKKTSTTQLRRKSSASRNRGGASKDEGKSHGGIPIGNPTSGNMCSGGNVAGSSGASSVHNKLEQDYIQMYLGELSPMQESKLVQLKSRVSDLLKGKVPSDPVFLRFLRARDFNVDKAREMLSQSLIWRKKHGVDKILSEYELPTVAKEYFPGAWYKHDNEDRPLFILRLGVMDVKGIIKSVGEEGLTKLTLHVCEEGLRLTEEASHRLNRPISQWCLLLDLEGLNMRHLWRPGMKALLHIIEICEANYPETLGRVLIVRAPRVFPIMWTLVSPLIDETSREKFLFYGGNDYQGPGGLADYIDCSMIPDWLGGPSFCPIPEGGLVPKSYYMSVEEFEKDQSPGPHLLEDSFYNSASISKGQVHEGILHNSDKGSVITWDFDVMRHDVVFTVYRLKIPLSLHSLAPNSSSTLSAGEKSSSSSSQHPHHHHQSTKSSSNSSNATSKTSPQPSPKEQNGGGTKFTFPAKHAVKEQASTESLTHPDSPKKSNNKNSSNNSDGKKDSNAGIDPGYESSRVGDEKHGKDKHLHQAGQHGDKQPGTFAGTNTEHKSLLLGPQGTGREGVDYFKVEASIVCHDGESIQGSHVTSHVGTYVLQWRFFDSAKQSLNFGGGSGAMGGGGHSHSPMDVIDSLTTSQHKAKIMYYYETLSSIDYRGSMTSLQSCQSAFSNISKTSLKHHHDHTHNKHRHSDDQHSMTSGISSGGMSQSTDGGGGTGVKPGMLYPSGEQSYSVIPSVNVMPPTSPGTPTTILTTPISSSSSSTVHTISGSSVDGGSNNQIKGNG